MQHELPELQKRLAKTEADLLKALEGEKKASEEVSCFTLWILLRDMNLNHISIIIRLCLFDGELQQNVKLIQQTRANLK